MERRFWLKRGMTKGTVIQLVKIFFLAFSILVFTFLYYCIFVFNYFAFLYLVVKARGGRGPSPSIGGNDYSLDQAQRKCNFVGTLKCAHSQWSDENISVTSQLSSPIQLGCPLMIVCESKLVSNPLTWFYFAMRTTIFEACFGKKEKKKKRKVWFVFLLQDIGSCSIKTPYNSAPLEVIKERKFEKHLHA